MPKVRIKQVLNALKNQIFTKVIPYIKRDCKKKKLRTINIKWIKNPGNSMELLWMTKFSRDSLIIFTLGLGLVSLSSATEITCNGYKIFSLGSLSEWEYSWRPHAEMFPIKQKCEVVTWNYVWRHAVWHGRPVM